MRVREKNCHWTRSQLHWDEARKQEVEESDVNISEPSSLVISKIQLLLETTDELEITEIR